MDIQLVLDGYETREFTITKDTQEEMVIRLRKRTGRSEVVKDAPVLQATPKSSTMTKTSSKPKVSTQESKNRKKWPKKVAIEKR